MSERLVIRLDGGSAGSASWVAVDATGALLGEVVSGELAAAGAAAAGRQVIVLVPAADVLHTRVLVPLRSGPRLLQALPFALEEQLAEDVDLLHFAAGSRDADEAVAVAVVRRSLMEEWLARLSEAGIEPARLYSLADAVAGMPNTVTVLLEADAAVVIPAGAEAASIDAASLASFLGLYIGDGEGNAERGAAEPLHLVVYGAEAALASVGPALEALRGRLASLELRVLAEDPLPRLAAHITTSNSGINLLQGDFARRPDWLAWWPAWRVAAMLLAALAIAMAASGLASAYRTGQELAAVNAAVDQAFHHVFPDAGQVTDARRELSVRLQQLGARGSGAGQEFLDMLRVLAQALGDTGTARIEALSYRGGALELRLRAPSVEFLDRVQQQLSQTGGLQARIQSANATGDEVIGRLQITRGGG